MSKTYYITGSNHWDHMRYLHAKFHIDEQGTWWPVLLMEIMYQEMDKQLGIPAHRI